MRAGMIALAALLGAGSLQAQSAAGPWVGAGLGASSGSYDCGACGDLPAGTYGTVEAGWMVSARAGAGLAIIGTFGTDGTVGHRGGLVVGQFEVRPIRGRGLELGVAAGYGRFGTSIDGGEESNELEAAGAAVGLLLGWAVPLSGEHVLHPRFGYYLLLGGEGSANGTGTGFDLGRSAFLAGVSLRWHGLGQ